MQPLRAEPRLTRRNSRPTTSAATAERRAAAVPHDPAPSRLSYRLERLRLTPGFHSAMRVWLPVVVLAVSVGAWFSSETHRADVAAKYTAIKEQIQNRPEFMVTLMQVDGASPAVDGAIRRIAPATLPVSSFKLDLDGMRQRMEQLDAVKAAVLRIQGGVLRVDITERVPVVIWRNEAGMELLDDSGHRVATLLARDGRGDLPLIAGAGAEAHVPEAMAILSALAPVMSRVRGLVYMGERRWDVVLDRGQRILLPENAPVVAAERAMALDGAQDLLGRDVVDVDLRNAARPTLRLTPAALSALRQQQSGQAIQTKVAGQ
jgi:cell division protein FtsQ